MHGKRLQRFIGIDTPRHCATNTLERLVHANLNYGSDGHPDLVTERQIPDLEEAGMSIVVMKLKGMFVLTV